MSFHQNDRAEFQATQACQTDRNAYNGMAAEVTNLWRAPVAGQSRQNMPEGAVNISKAAPGVRDNGFDNLSGRGIADSRSNDSVGTYGGDFGNVLPGKDNHINHIANLREGSKLLPNQGAESLNGKKDGKAMLNELKNGGLRENVSDIPGVKSLPAQHHSINEIFHGDRENIRAGEVAPVRTNNMSAGEVAPVVQNNARRNQGADSVLSGKGDRGYSDNKLEMPPLNWGYHSPSSKPAGVD
jgi:hypothetical protein